MIWITKNQPREWKFGKTDAGGNHLADYISCSQLNEAIEDLTNFSETNYPFMLLDVRESHERDIKDVVDKVYTSDKAIKIPRVNLIYEELVTGAWNQQYFSRDIWIVCLC